MIVGTYLIKEETEIHTIIFYGAEQEEIERREVEDGQAIGELPEQPEKEGYTFVEWVDQNGKTVSDETIVEDDLNVYARLEMDYPAMTADGAANGIRVHVVVPEGALPRDSRLRVASVNSENYREQAEDAIGGEAGRIKAVDIYFVDKNGQEVHPLKPITVRFGVAEMKDADDVSIVHVSDAGDADVIASGLSGSNYSISSGDFSVYIVVETGEDARLTVEFRTDDTDAGLISTQSVTRAQLDAGALNDYIFAGVVKGLPGHLGALGHA